MRSNLFMSTTKVSSEQTAGEITRVLAKGGAKQIMIEYGADQQATGITFAIEISGQSIAYKLPIRVGPVFALLHKERRHSHWKYKDADQEQAVRTAWRQVLRWVEAQLALVQTGMVDVREVFTAYMLCGTGETLYERVAGSQYKLLEMDQEPRP